MSRRVVITGMGAITPVGNTVPEFWDSLKKGTVGFGPITYFDTSLYKVHVAAQVKNFDAEAHMDRKSARRMESFCQFAVAAAKEAMLDSKLVMENEDPYMVGCCIASGIGSLQVLEREVPKIMEGNPGKVSPLMVPSMISNMASGNVAIQLGLCGKNINVVTACASGTNAIGEAMRTIQYGDATIMFAGGAEASITQIGLSGFSALNALSTTEDVNRCSIPFDRDRNGFVMGEGAGVLVLEELEHALHRGATIYAELVGYGCSDDAYHITAPKEDGVAPAMAMKKAMCDAKVEPSDVIYINAHGTSTHHNDLIETKAIKNVFGENAKNVYINSTKSMIGHLLGAAGAVECIVCVKTLQDGYIHKTAGYTNPDDELDLNYCKQPVHEAVSYALSNSLGFGGHNATILLKKYEG